MVEVLFILIIIFIFMYYIINIKYGKDNMIYEKATFDDEYYWVRDLKDKSQAANTLAKIKRNMIILIKHLKNNKESHKNKITYINDLVTRTEKIYIMETPEDDEYTSYTINKGEKIVFCIRSKIIEEIHDMNTLMYVVIHELAHVACPEYGHTPLFREIFKFLLVESDKIGIYKITNYTENPKNYCGMTINEYLFD
jgi:hypothetical protein